MIISLGNPQAQLSGPHGANILALFGLERPIRSGQGARAEIWSTFVA